MDMDDSQLLRRYATGDDRPAMEQLIRRHAPWLYAAARRQVGDAHSADDVTQAVLLLLIRKAAALQNHPNLGGWLFTTLRYCVAAAQRQATSQRRHETEAARMRPEPVPPQNEATWDQIGPHLDAAVASLGKSDRHAILLRYYELKPLLQVAQTLGISEEAAKKRVQRALAKLREKLAGKGITTAATSLGTVLASQRLEAAPATAVDHAISAITGTTATHATAGTIAEGAIKMMAWAKAKAVAAVAVAILAFVGGVAVVAQTSTTPPPATPPTAQATPAAAQRASGWRAQFNALYGLNDDKETVKRIAPPYVTARTAYWKAVDPRPANDPTGAPDQIAFTWNGDLKDYAMAWGTVDSLSSVLHTVMGWGAGELEGPRDLMARRLPGDWIVRANATEQEKLAAMLAILHRDVDPTITIHKRQVEREAIIARGKFQYHPHPDARGRMQILLYADPYVAQEDGGGGAGSLAGVLGMLGSCTGLQVIDQVEGDRPEMLSFHTLSSCWIKTRPTDPNRDAKLDSLLGNVASQTGLTLTREKQKVSVWVVGRANSD